MNIEPAVSRQTLQEAKKIGMQVIEVTKDLVFINGYGPFRVLSDEEVLKCQMVTAGTTPAVDCNVPIPCDGGCGKTIYVSETALQIPKKLCSECTDAEATRLTGEDTMALLDPAKKRAKKRWIRH